LLSNRGLTGCCVLSLMLRLTGCYSGASVCMEQSLSFVWVNEWVCVCVCVCVRLNLEVRQQWKRVSRAVLTIILPVTACNFVLIYHTAYRVSEGYRLGAHRLQCLWGRSRTNCWGKYLEVWSLNRSRTKLTSEEEEEEEGGGDIIHKRKVNRGTESTVQWKYSQCIISRSTDFNVFKSRNNVVRSFVVRIWGKKKYVQGFGL
jgi:hypothetical protein